MPRNVRVEWRQGSTGLGAVYVFNPNPDLSRESPAKKQAEFDIPLRDGVEVQDLGMDKRIVTLKGVLYAKSEVFEDLEDLRIALIEGIGTDPGQLHIISRNSLSNSKHIIYSGQLSAQGIVFEPQINSIFLDYTISILCADSLETYQPSKTISSDAKVV